MEYSPNILNRWRHFGGRIHRSVRLLGGIVLLSGCPAWSQYVPGIRTVPATREWTNLDGRKISADYLGIQGSNVVLKLSDGTISEVPLVKLSAVDNEFIRLNPIEYHVPWQAWPKERSGATTHVVVTEESAGAGGFVYTTRNFKFHSDVNLGMQLMTDMANEGYAEYISHIPIEAKRFRTSPEQIREGIQEMFVQEYEKSRSRPDSKPARLDKAARAAFLTGNDLPELFKVEKVLQMTDHEWATGSKATPPPATGKPPTPGVEPMIFIQTPDPKRLPRLYRTAHLIIYYFIQIEGENGVNKIRRFLEENRHNLAKYEQYREQYRIYEQEVRHFMELPGVTKTTDGRIRYPSNLQLPSAPKPPFTDPNILKQGGLIMLLARESPAAVGRRIESALVKDLGMNLKFVENPKSKLLLPGFKH